MENDSYALRLQYYNFNYIMPQLYRFGLTLYYIVWIEYINYSQTSHINFNIYIYLNLILKNYDLKKIENTTLYFI